MIRRAFLCVFALVLLSAMSAAQTKSIEGVWKVTEVSSAASGSTKTSTQPGLYLFTKKHYSLIYVASDGPRADTADLSKMTADELRSNFVSSFFANAGTYEMKAGKLTMRPQVAKNPGFMGPDVWQTVLVTGKGNTMTLVGEATNQGPIKSPATIKLTRVE